jgi:ssDNA-binding Zn-finger/Zn-ribbon topoisomerase 1
MSYVLQGVDVSEKDFWRIIKNSKNLDDFEQKLFQRSSKKINSKKIVCHECGSEMVVSNSRYGPYYKCISFPNCLAIKSLSNAIP